MALFDLPGKTILLHNRCGIRIEFNAHQNGRLELWLSPQAGKDHCSWMRNFSNRDDHCRLFDAITIPGLSAESFVRCDYDPFESTIHFKDQTLHVLSVFDKPAVVVWFDKPQKVDFKSDKADQVVARSPKLFHITHPDRGLELDFVALLGKGSGSFWHQPVMDRGRSSYARAQLAPGQCLVVGGELKKEKVAALCSSVLKASPRALSSANEKLIGAALKEGSFTFNNHPEFQKLFDVNRRVLLAMQDRSGAIRAAINRIYYLIWVRDGALTEVMQAYSGNVEPLVRWTEFLLANPTRISDEQPQGTMFGQLVNKITKWQEDGCFYAVWSVFSAWTQTGDDAFVAPRYQKVLHASLSWLEQYCFDAERGLFGRYFANETPFSGAHDEGYDGAVGAPGDPSWLERGWEKLKIIYDLELNLCMYSVYSMLAAMTTGKKAAEQLEAKAQALAVELEQYFEEADEAGMPTYGHLILHSGTELVEPPYSLDYADYVYSFALPPFTPFTLRNKRILTAIVRDSLDNKRRGFLGAYYAVFAKADPLWIDERDIVAAFEQGAAVSIPPGGVLPMPYAAIENFDRTDGDVIRPQAFTIGPWLAALTGVGLRRLPFGIALRPTTLLASLSAYRYRHALLDVVFSGKGRWCSVSLNGKELEGTLQLPEKKLRRGKNRVAVVATEAQAKGPTLIGSTVRLLSVQRFGTGGFTYALECYGRNVVEFVGAVGCSIQVVDENDRAVEHIVSRDEQLQVVEFGGRGGRWVIVEQGDEQQ